MTKPKNTPVKIGPIEKKVRARQTIKKENTNGFGFYNNGGGVDDMLYCDVVCKLEQYLIVQQHLYKKDVSASLIIARALTMLERLVEAGPMKTNEHELTQGTHFW